MDSKNYTQVLIDGKIYTLGGSEDEAYLQKAASYVNEKNNTLRRIPGFTKQSADYQTVMVELNLADDYFKALEHSQELERQRNDMERETYSLKHELVSTQMKLEVVLKDLAERQRELEELAREKHRLERKLREASKNRAEQEAAAASLRETSAKRAGNGRGRGNETAGSDAIDDDAVDATAGSGVTESDGADSAFGVSSLETSDVEYDGADEEMDDMEDCGTVDGEQAGSRDENVQFKDETAGSAMFHGAPADDAQPAAALTDAGASAAAAEAAAEVQQPKESQEELARRALKAAKAARRRKKR